MSERDHRELRMALGPYVLGQLGAEEAAHVEDHLASCAGCRAERDALLPVAAALADLRTAGERVVRPVEGDRTTQARPRGWRAAGLAGVAVAATLVVLVAGLALTRSDSDPSVPSVPLEAVAVVVVDPAVEAEADLVAHTWGVEVKLTATGFEDGSRYRVAVLGLDGTRHPAGGFVGTGDNPMRCSLNSSVLRPKAAGFEVRDLDGELVASARFDG